MAKVRIKSAHSTTPFAGVLPPGSEETYRAFFQDMPVGIAIVSGNGKIIAHNEMIRKITGYSTYDADEMNISDVYGKKEDRERILAILNRDGSVHNFETVLKRKGGSLFFASLSIVSYKVHNENLYLLVMQDISERKQAELSLAESEERLFYIINLLPDPTFAINAEGCIIVWNKAMEKMTGVASVSILGKGGYEHAIPFYGEHRPMLADIVLRPNREAEKAYQFISRDIDCYIAEPLTPLIICGEEKYLWAKASPLFDAEGRIAGAIEIVRDITEWKKAEKMLQKNKSTIQTLLDTNPETEFLIDKAGTILAGNHTFAKRIDKNINEIIGLSLKDLFPSDIAKLRTNKINEVIDSHKIVHFIDSRNKRIYDNYYHPVFDEEGNMEMIAVFAKDITDQTLANEELRESEERYRLTIEGSTDGVAIINDNVHLYVNDRFVHMFGYDNANEIVGKPSTLTIHPDDHDRVSEYNFKIQNNENGPNRYEVKGLRKDGGIIDVEVSATRINYHKQPAILIYEHNITEKKNAERRLLASEEKYRLLIDMASEGVIVVQEGKLCFANNRMLEIGGYSGEEIVGRSFFDFVHPEDRQLVAEQYTKRLEGKGLDAYAFRIIPRSDIVIWIEVRGTDFTWDGKPSQLYFLNDITERKQAEEQASLQRNFAITLAGALNLDNTLSACIEMAIKVSNMDSGAIYLFEDTSTYMKLAITIGLSCSFVDRISALDEQSPLWFPGEKHDAVYFSSTSDLLSHKAYVEERIQCIAIVPIHHQEMAIGCVIVSSHILKEFPSTKKNILETITAQMGNTIQRIRSEEKYRGIYENITEGIFRSTPAGIFQSVNPSMANMLGFDTPDEMIKSIKNIATDYYVKPDRWITFKEMLETKNTIYAFESEVYGKQGKIWVSENAHTVRNSQNDITYYDGTVENITNRKVTTDALRNSELRYRTLLDNIHDAVFLISNGLFLDCNEKALKMFCCKKHDIFNKTPLDFSPESQPDGSSSSHIMKLRLARALSGNPQFFEWQFKKSENKIFDSEVSLNVIQLGDATYLQVIVRDVTQQKENELSLRMSLEKLRKATNGIIDVISMAIEMKDPYTAGHQKRVANLARSISKLLNLPQERIDGIRIAGTIHDLGKISIPSEILTRPRALTTTEYSLVKTHSQIGYDILKDIDFPWPIAQVVYQHHERLDGSGYPRCLRQADILMEARILAVADVVESMASHRPYRPSLGIDAALQEIQNNKGTLYDAEVVNACVRLFKENKFSFE